MQQESLASIDIIGIVGAGAMGRGIAQIAAQAGVRVRLFDLQAGAAASARDQIKAQLSRLQEKGKLSAAAVSAAVGGIEPAAALDDFADCQIVIEAIVEQLEAKRTLFRALENIVGKECILATNTSSLAVTAIAAAVALPQRVAGFHFFNPVPLMKVVEVISGVLTDERVAACLAAFAERIGHKPVLARDTPGFIVNHAGRGYVTEALRIVQESAADFTQVDDVLREAAGFRLGPFQLMDLTGLDVSHPVMESIYQQYYQEPRYRPSVLTAQRLSAGLLGRKNGRGFYHYDDASVTATAPAAVPGASAWNGPVWISASDAAAREQVAALLGRCGITLETGAQPSSLALCVVTPLGDDVTSCAVRQALDPRRTVGIDTLTDCAGRLTLMSNPATTTEVAVQAKALFEQSGQPVTLIDDSTGFIVQRVLATIVNIGCDIVQQGICTPEDLDCAVELGLGYPRGPLAWGDPRYRPSPWLLRRAQLGLSLRQRRG